MVTLSLFRHAKSSWTNRVFEDFDRPLAPRGIKSAPEMGSYMRDAGIVPDIVLCSPARRTRATLDIVAPYFARKPIIRFEDELYPAAPADMLARVREIPEEYSHALVLAHNPGLHELAVSLVGSGEEKSLRELRSKFATGALAVIEFPDSWPSIAPGQGHLRIFMTPRKLQTLAGSPSSPGQ